jgi:carbamoyl-phosphate synthase small subunit
VGRLWRSLLYWYDGYQEIFTDPSYYGQIMVATNAHIGNYGVNENEVGQMGNIRLVCKIFNYSRADSSESLEDYFIKSYLYFRCRY